MVGHDYNRFPDLSVGQSMHSLADRIRCAICLNIYKKPMATRCGHAFCFDCIAEWVSSAQTVTKECPVCHESIAKTSLDDSVRENEMIIGGNVLLTRSALSDIIDALLITCDNQGNGCPEVVPLESLSLHLKTCHYKVCETCDLRVGLTPVGHNCVDSLKTDRNQWHEKYTEVVINCKKWKTKAIECQNKLEFCEERASDWEQNCKNIKKLNNQLIKKCQKLESALEEAQAMANSRDANEKPRNTRGIGVRLFPMSSTLDDIIICHSTPI